MIEPTPTDADNNPQTELEELSEALEMPASPEALSPGTSLESPDGTLRIDAFLGRKSAVNLYEATFQEDREVWLRETEDGVAAERLRHEFEVFAALKCPMFPQAFSCFDKDGRTYMATEPVVGPTMADALASKEMGVVQLLSVLAQVAFAVSQLHAQGWSHLALRPTSVVMGRPIRLTDLGYSTRLGQKPPAAFYFSGYSAPELLADKPVDGRADIYSIGALLFHAVSGNPIPESGAALTGWEPEMPLAGVPQFLHKCVGPIETRYATATELHRDLLRLVRRYVPRVRYEHASATTVGLEPTRTVNQDAWGFSSVQSEAEEASQAWAIAAVADGMGGMAAGELASAVAVNTVLTEATAALMANPSMGAEEQAQLTAEWVRNANDKVCDEMEAHQARGGCTLVCAVLIERRLAIAHVGDCRIYLIRDGSIKTLTRDHSVAMGLVMQGELDISELRTYPDRSNVTRSLGERKKLPGHYVDTLGQTTGDDITELQAGDTLLLCSDGLWEPVLEEAVVDVLADAGPNLTGAAKRLIDLAMQAGAPDNATVSLLRIADSSQAQSKV